MNKGEKCQSLKILINAACNTSHFIISANQSTCLGLYTVLSKQIHQLYNQLVIQFIMVEKINLIPSRSIFSSSFSYGNHLTIPYIISSGSRKHWHNLNFFRFTRSVQYLWDTLFLYVNVFHKKGVLKSATSVYAQCITFMYVNQYTNEKIDTGGTE